MSELVEIKVGDFVVVRTLTFPVYCVEKVTEKTFSYQSRWSAKPIRHNRAAVCFAGPEVVANRLSDQLKSSQAIERNESRESSERRRERDEAYIAAALSQARGEK